MSRLYVMVGLPGSGKSTYAKTLKANHVSRDEIRFSLLNEEDEYFSKENKVFNLFIEEIQKNIDAKEDVVADATHLNKIGRYKLLKNLKLNDVEVILKVMTTPIDVCLERNSKRSGRQLVPEDTIIAMNKNFTIPVIDELCGFRYTMIDKVEE